MARAVLKDGFPLNESRPCFFSMVKAGIQIMNKEAIKIIKRIKRDKGVGRIGSADAYAGAGSIFRSDKRREVMNERKGDRQANPKPDSYTILQRIGRAERAAVEDCVSAYGNLVWALARKFAVSPEEAEKATIDIFNDVWTRAPFYDSAKQTEESYILQIAVRRLNKQPAARGSSK